MSTKYKIAIIDDNTGCIGALNTSLTRYENVKVVGTAQTHLDARRLVLDQHPDLLFLDMEMPEITGIQFLREIKTFLCWPMHVVFYTAYEKYLLDALREAAFDYLLKPFTQNELQIVMDRFFAANETSQSINANLENLSHILPESRTFLVSTVTGYRTIESGSVGFFEYVKGEKRWHAHSDREVSCPLKRATTTEMILSYSPSYVQINQQHIINFDYLFKVDGKNCILLPPFDNRKTLSISRDFYKGFKEYFDLI